MTALVEILILTSASVVDAFAPFHEWV